MSNIYKMMRHYGWTIVLIGLTACGGGGGSGGTPATNNQPGTGNGNTGSGIQNRAQAQQAISSVLDAQNMFTYAELYAMVIGVGELLSNNPATGTTVNCMFAGTGSLVLQDLNGDGHISSGESVDLSFNNCANISTLAVNGAIHQDLISFDATFLPGAIFPSTYNNWVAQFKFSNLNRTAADGTAYHYDGAFKFDFNKLQNSTGDGHLVISSDNLLLKQGSAEYTLVNYTIDSTSNTATDSTNIALTGTIIDPTIGSLTVSSALLTLNNASTDTATLTGAVTVTSGLSKVTCSFSSNGSVIFMLDSNGDGVVDDTWSAGP